MLSIKRYQIIPSANRLTIEEDGGERRVAMADHCQDLFDIAGFGFQINFQYHEIICVCVQQFFGRGRVRAVGLGEDHDMMVIDKSLDAAFEGLERIFLSRRRRVVLKIVHGLAFAVEVERCGGVDDQQIGE